MSQNVRRSLAMASLVVALFLVAPVPSQAAGWGEETGVASLFERVWQWMEIFGLGSPDASPEKGGLEIDPDGRPGEAKPQNDQGVMIDPDGLK